MNVKGYLVTVTALVILTETAKFLMPRGKTQKTVEIILAVIVIVTLVSPVLRLINAPVGNVFGEKEYFQDTSYLTRLDETNERLVRSEVASLLKKYDLPYDTIDVEGGSGKIKKVKIYLSDKVIDEKSEHIIVTEITRSVAAYIGISEEAVEFVE